MRIRQVDWDDADSVALRAAQRAELTERYNDPNTEPGIAPSASDITAFFVAYVDDQAVGCGGLRELSGTEAEIKRMFVDPRHRGTGVSTAIVQELEDFGRARGWNRLVLETGDGQPDAVRFYEREGFTRIPNFGYYADQPRSLCYGKPLFATDPQADLVCESCE